MASYEPATARSDRFIKIALDLPHLAISNATRFRFMQPIFEAARDNWALDNVRVFRSLPSDWHSALAAEHLGEGQEAVQLAQCCADTDWCAKRLSENQRKQCQQFSWYASDSRYLFRLSEIFLCVCLLVNVVRFVYLSGYDYLVRQRYPFHDEIIAFLRTDTINTLLKRLPLAWRPRTQRAHKEIDSIHTAARLEEELRGQFEDDEAQGVMFVRKEAAEKEKQEMAAKIRKVQKKLAKRQANKNYKMVVPIDEQKESEEVLAIPTLEDLQQPSEGEGMKDNVLLNDLEKLRRQNLAQLRVPFTIDTDKTWVQTFAYVLLVVFLVLFLFELSRMPNYSMYEPFTPFNAFETTLYVNSFVMLFFSAFCDAKEIYAVLRNHIPLWSSWEPLVTLDLSDDQRSLFIDDHTIPLANIREIAAFPESFAYLLAAGLVLGAFPWCLLALLLRETALTYDTMRFVTPFLGVLMIIRATIGPTIFIKTVFAVQYLFSINFHTREVIGNAIQQESTWISGLNVAVSFCILAGLITAFVAFDWMALVVPAAIIGGTIYGVCTGTAHHLPIKPWLCKPPLLLPAVPALTPHADLTSLRGGVWLQVRKRQSCPCVYWGKYCTSLHQYEELCVLFTTDDIKFTSLLNNGITAVETFLPV